jgi:hypothetical protein
LTSIPPDIPSDTQELSLRNNSIATVPDNVFADLSQLAQLDLAVNKINYLSPSAFAGTKLTKLDMSYNNLLAFPNLTVIGQSLVVLNFANNADMAGSSITPQCFQDLQKLTYLNLNAIKVPQYLPFKSRIPLLKTLILQGTSMLNITSELQKLGDLNELLLSEGSFTFPVSDVEFYGTTTKTLFLEDMQIRKFPYFPSLATKLTALCLDKNPLESPIRPRSFHQFKVLTKLSMGGCGITTFPNVTALNATLQELYLNWNTIQIGILECDGRTRAFGFILQSSS